MGFFDNFDFFGKKAGQEIEKGAAQARGEIDTAEVDASGNLTQGRNALTQARDAAMPLLDKGYATATSRFDPSYTAGSAAAQKLYMDAIGANGVEAQQAAAKSFYDADPFRQHNADQVTNALTAKYAATGDSGNARLAVARANLDLGSQDWNKIQDRWRDAGAQGLDTAGKLASLDVGHGEQGANLLTGYGKSMADNWGQAADLAWGAGTTRAGNTINTANAKAANAGTGLNNVLKFLQIGANAAATAMGGKKPGA